MNKNNVAESDRKSIVILDTNIFLHDYRSIYAFPGRMLMIPLEVIEEIDDQKRRVDEVGRNARMTSKVLDELRNKGSLSTGVRLENGCEVRVELSDPSLKGLPPSLRANKEDNRILATALSIRNKFPDHDCCFVTKDINMRIKADAVGIKATDFEEGKIELEELYTGCRALDVAQDLLSEFHKSGRIPADRLEPLFPNEIVTLNCGQDSAHCRFDQAENAVVPLSLSMKDSVAAIAPRNLEQLFALELLLNPNIQLVTLNGRAGTGKTLLALAAGVRQVLEEAVYQKLLVSRPVVPLGKDLGFLPGSVQDKLDPWMVPLYDNFEIIFSAGLDKKQEREKRDIRNIIEGTPLIQVEALSYIRGRSMPDQFLLVDEAQNLSPHEVKTIITRAGKNTKVVLTGDPYQIDHPYLDSNSNGLNYVVEKFKSSPLSGHITLVRGERSELAETAAELL